MTDRADLSAVMREQLRAKRARARQSSAVVVPLAIPVGWRRGEGEASGRPLVDLLDGLGQVS